MPIDMPVVAMPPLRPEAPNPTVCCSKRSTFAPCRARWSAATTPVSPPPMTATSVRPSTVVLDLAGELWGAVSSQ
jgi:hypothetical protein